MLPIILLKVKNISNEEESLFDIVIIGLVTESLQSDSIDSSVTLDNEEKPSTIKCDSCQELFQTSEQFNQHRLYQCSFLPGNQHLIKHEMSHSLLILSSHVSEETNSDDSRTSSYDDYANQIDTVRSTCHVFSSVR